jgi:ABC-type uncharacterized transport system permease subunit
MLIYDHLIQMVCVQGCLLAGVFAGLAGAIYAIGQHIAPAQAIGVGLVCFVVAFITATAITAILDSMCSSMFICYVHYPDDFAHIGEFDKDFAAVWEERGQDFGVDVRQSQPLNSNA